MTVLVMDEGGEENSFTSNTWVWHQSNQQQPNSSVYYVKVKPIPPDERFECQKVTFMLIKILNVSQGPGAQNLLSSCHLNYQSGTRIQQEKNLETWSYKSAHSLEVRWDQACSLMRSSEGKNNKDNDQSHKLCCGHIKLSTHSLGQVSAGLGMKTLNPTKA